MAVWAHPSVGGHTKTTGRPWFVLRTSVHATRAYVWRRTQIQESDSRFALAAMSEFGSP